MSPLLNKLKVWTGEQTTQAGLALIGGGVTSILTHAATWQVAAIPIVGGLMLAIFRENDPIVGKVTGDLIGVGAAIGTGTSPVNAVVAALPVLGADLQAALAIMGAAHAATPAGGVTTSSVVNGVASTTTSMPLAPLAASTTVTATKQDASGATATETVKVTEPAADPVAESAGAIIPPIPVHGVA